MAELRTIFSPFVEDLTVLLETEFTEWPNFYLK
jgi:hypothetical protein